MLTAFEQLIGAAGDVKELEYISSLHQTDVKELRRDASIKAQDIRLFLSSRHGISVSNEEVHDLILYGLGGGSQDNDTLDLMEFVAALLIPTILKAADEALQQPRTTTPCTDYDYRQRRCLVQVEEEEQEQDGDTSTIHSLSGARKPSSTRLKGKSTYVQPEDEVVPPPPGLLQTALDVILQDATGDMQPKKLTEDLIRQLLVSFGELGLAMDDTLVQEMLDACRSPGDTAAGNDNKLELDVFTFAQALTHDVRIYNVRNELQPITNFQVATGRDAKNNPIEDDNDNYNTSNNKHGIKIPPHEQSPRDDEEPKLESAQQVKQMISLSSIDSTAGTYRSKRLTVSLWATIIVTYFGYSHVFRQQLYRDCSAEYEYDYAETSPWIENIDGINCHIVACLIDWAFLFGALCVFGFCSTLFGNIGNSLRRTKDPWRPLAGFIFVFLLVTLPFIFLRHMGSENAPHILLNHVSLVLGLFTCCLHLSHFVTCLMPSTTHTDARKQLPKLMNSTIMTEMNVRRAASAKLSTMASNALELLNLNRESHGVRKSIHGKALQNFGERGKQYVSTGGFFWWWKRVFLQRRQHCLACDGISTPARLVAGNVAQYVIAFYLMFAGAVMISTFSQNYNPQSVSQELIDTVQRTIDMRTAVAEEFVANVSSLISDFIPAMEATGVEFNCTNVTNAVETYCQSDMTGEELMCSSNPSGRLLCPFLDNATRDELNSSAVQGLLAGAGFRANTLLQFTLQVAQDAVDESISTLYPAQKHMVMVPVCVAVTIAVFLALLLAVTYMPSVSTTVLRLRCGSIPTLRSKNFYIFRQRPDEISLLTGYMFWGVLVACILFGGFVGVVIFFFLWQATSYFAQWATAMMVGLSAVLLLRIVLERVIFGCSVYGAFYRERPAVANMAMLALEWANFAVSVGFILVRVAFFIGAGALYIGRIDTKFLSPDIDRLGPFELDKYPRIHMQDILSHEAHRHPYIELMGIIYVMKLRHGPRFAKRAGSAWRLLLVYAIMPWLHKYRVEARREETIEGVMPDISFSGISYDPAPASSAMMDSQSRGDEGTQRSGRASELDGQGTVHSRRSNLRMSDLDGQGTVHSRRSNLRMSDLDGQGTVHSRRNVRRSVLSRDELLSLKEIQSGNPVQSKRASLLIFRPELLDNSLSGSESGHDKTWATGSFRARQSDWSESAYASDKLRTSFGGGLMDWSESVHTENDRHRSNRIAELEAENERLKAALALAKKKSTEIPTSSIDC